MPSVFGKEGKKKELIKNLDALYAQLQREHQISPGDFPELAKMQEQLVNHDFTKFHALDRKLLERVDNMLAVDIAKLMVRKQYPEVRKNMDHQSCDGSYIFFCKENWSRRWDQLGLPQLYFCLTCPCQSVSKQLFILLSQCL